jgi:hypothetical protein
LEEVQNIINDPTLTEKVEDSMDKKIMKEWESAMSEFPPEEMFNTELKAKEEVVSLNYDYLMLRPFTKISTKVETM